MNTVKVKFLDRSMATKQVACVPVNSVVELIDWKLGIGQLWLTRGVQVRWRFVTVPDCSLHVRIDSNMELPANVPGIHSPREWLSGLLFGPQGAGSAIGQVHEMLDEIEHRLGCLEWYEIRKKLEQLETPAFKHSNLSEVLAWLDGELTNAVDDAMVGADLPPNVLFVIPSDLHHLAGIGLPIAVGEQTQDEPQKLYHLEDYSLVVSHFRGQDCYHEIPAGQLGEHETKFAVVVCRSDFAAQALCLCNPTPDGASTSWFRHRLLPPPRPGYESALLPLNEAALLAARTGDTEQFNRTLDRIPYVGRWRKHAVTEVVLAARTVVLDHHEKNSTSEVIGWGPSRHSRRILESMVDTATQRWRIPPQDILLAVAAAGLANLATYAIKYIPPGRDPLEREHLQSAADAASQQGHHQTASTIGRILSSRQTNQHLGN